MDEQDAGMSDDELERDPATGKPGTVGGGRTARGPEPDPRGTVDPGGLVPPYEGRTTSGGQTESARANVESTARQLAHADPGKVGATASPAEEHPVDPSEVSTAEARGTGDQTATDTTAASPHGVGISSGARGEDVAEREHKEAGRKDTGRDETGRPHGTSTPRDLTGVNPPED